ncbi:MAG: hypothetical protein AB7O98_17550 [Hyphomonadaceae bacterium]
MRILIAAALAVCLSGAAWAGEKHTPDAECGAFAERVDADAIRRDVEAAIDQAFAASAGPSIDDEITVHLETALEEALAEEFAELDARLAAEEAARNAEIDALIEARLAEVEVAIERAAARLAAAEEASLSAPKRWRPRY